MNRGLQFFTPTAEEWSAYNEKIHGRRADASGDTPSAGYVTANSMPAFVLNLTQPDLNWCVDCNLLNRRETKINVGSSYFVMDRCILGPKLTCWEASVDRRAAAYIESFAKEVSNGLRWILEIYRTTNIMQQHDLFNTDLAVAKNIRNKLAFGSYAPIRLVAPLRDSVDCEEVEMSATGNSPFFVQPFGYCSGSTAPIGGTSQFTRPYLGTAALIGSCSTADLNRLAVKDPTVMSADDVRRLNEYITKNREQAVNRSYGIFKPPSGLSEGAPSVQTANVTRGTAAFGMPVLDQTGPHGPPTPAPEAVSSGIPQPNYPSFSPISNNDGDVNMGNDGLNEFIGMGGV